MFVLTCQVICPIIRHLSSLEKRIPLLQTGVQANALADWISYDICHHWNSHQSVMSRWQRWCPSWHGHFSYHWSCHSETDIHRAQKIMKWLQHRLATLFRECTAIFLAPISLRSLNKQNKSHDNVFNHLNASPHSIIFEIIGDTQPEGWSPQCHDTIGMVKLNTRAYITVSTVLLYMYDHPNNVDITITILMETKVSQSLILYPY